NFKIEQIQQKFTSKKELQIFHLKHAVTNVQCLTLYWSVKESVYKWWGSGGVDFKRHIRIKEITGEVNEGIVYCLFRNKTRLAVHYLYFGNHYLTWVLTDH
ncbi:MAG TPA: 4'-phosphopantetheinyl transferase superfamily protein, partial [Ferruginibacter sp.]|nr:4'-phosphopantetheinyl transferase superfamily protein [Ferruginibacter sp.]